ncbi:hypothetical protein L4C54_19650 [Vibrio lamellibrachiae]|uniref:hypothetical protein n=1 Tax=Vibrio lamellibrachiae TaxID=2910253 RepID=UPI003D100F37
MEMQTSHSQKHSWFRLVLALCLFAVPVDVAASIPLFGIQYDSALGVTGSYGGSLGQSASSGYKGPYLEASIGKYGQGLDLGFGEGLFPKMSYGASVSYKHISSSSSDFKKDNYLGISGRFGIIGMLVKVGAYQGLELDEQKVSFSVGIGF